MVTYLHDLSEIKHSQRNNPYFNLTLQTKDKEYRTVCFSPEKHSKCKSNYESSFPVKISKYQIKRNRITDEDEVHMNKRTKLEDPKDNEVSFDIKSLPKVKKDETVHDVEGLFIWQTNSLVNTKGRITFTAPQETIHAKKKTLKKREAVLTDNTASIRLVLWEGDIQKITSGCTYELSNVAIKTYQDVKYATLNAKSTTKIAHAVVNRDDDITVDIILHNVLCPADGVKSINRQLSCFKCHTKVVPILGKKIIKCSECGVGQLKEKCSTRVYASILFSKPGEEINLTLFEDKLMDLYRFFKPDGASTDLSLLSDDDVMEFLLSVEAKIFYNNKKTVVSVTTI